VYEYRRGAGDYILRVGGGDGEVLHVAVAGIAVYGGDGGGAVGGV
jgi:hypothetical protein